MFALTFAAVTLRLYLPAAALLGPPMLASYRAISFLCWVPNLAIAELILAREQRQPSRSSPRLAVRARGKS